MYICPEFDLNKSLLFSEATGKESCSGIPAEVKERQRSTVSFWRVLLQRYIHLKKANANTC